MELTADKPLPGNAKSTAIAGRTIITDESAPSFDLPAQRLPLPKAVGRSVVSFQANSKDLAGKTHSLLFAAWPLSASQPCESKESYARSGCRRYGYVLV